jgi:Trypsin-like peptidase domain
MEIQSAADQLFFVTARIEGDGDDTSWIATGFVYAVDTDRGAAHFLVTNKHVLEGASRLTIGMLQASADQNPALGERADIILDPIGPHLWVGHPRDDVDVAVMPLSAALSRMQQEGTPVFFRSVPPALCLDEDSLNLLDAVEEVVFFGYPRGIYDTRNVLPVARRGTTATPVAVDYEGLPAFLVDASVFPGSSGSPVFLLDRGGTFRVRGTGTVQVGGRLICLGILAAVHVHQVEGTVRELPARFAVSVPELLNLGIVFKASTFDACVQPILDAAGLRRVAGAEPPTADEPTAADRQIEEELGPDT